MLALTRSWGKSSPLAKVRRYPDGVSPLSPTTPEVIIDITPEGVEKLKELRDQEPETDRLGLRVEIISEPGEEFRYDLSFEVVTQAAFSDEVRTVDGMKIIVPANSLELLTGSILDYNDAQGLIIRNPNKPLAPSVEGLVKDDQGFWRGRAVRGGQPNEVALDFRGRIAAAPHLAALGSAVTRGTTPPATR